MANFPSWIKNNNKTSTMNSSNLSPRQVANKAYTLAIKKLDRDDKRRRPQYTVRERLLLSNTMAKAEDVLNKRTPRFNRRVLACEVDDDILPPSKKMAMSPPSSAPAPVIKKEQEPNQVLEQRAQIQVRPTTISTPPAVMVAAPPQIKNESPMVTTKITITSAELQKAAVSIAAIAAAAAYSSLSVAEKQSFLSTTTRDSICRPIMIPSHTNMTSITTII